MSPYKDAQAEPAKGRVFPLTFVNVLGLLGKGRRITLVFRNPTPAERRQGLVAQFGPGKHLTLLSVPIELGTTAIELWPLIVRYCGWLARRSTSRRSGRGPVYDLMGVSPARPSPSSSAGIISKRASTEAPTSLQVASIASCSRSTNTSCSCLTNLSCKRGDWDAACRHGTHALGAPSRE
jgi:hypothetical protein